MSWENLLAFNLVLGAALASPGAAFLMALRTALSQGRIAGIMTGIGLATAAVVWTFAALLGLDAFFAMFPWAYGTLKLLGALYLGWLAFKTWRHARDPVAELSPPAHHRAFLTGALVNLGNPKSMLFAAAVLVVVFPQGLSGPHIALILANHWALEVLFYTGLALALTTRSARNTYLSLKPAIDRIAATLLGALGLRLLLEK